MIFSITLWRYFGDHRSDSRSRPFHFIPDDFRLMAQTSLFRPSHLMTAWGANLGGYIGGLIGSLFALWRVWTRQSHLQAAEIKR